MVESIEQKLVAGEFVGGNAKAPAVTDSPAQDRHRLLTGKCRRRFFLRLRFEFGVLRRETHRGDKEAKDYGDDCIRRSGR